MEYDFESVKAEKGILKTGFKLKVDEVVYLEIQKKDIEAMQRNASALLMEQWNNAMMLNEK